MINILFYSQHPGRNFDPCTQGPPDRPKPEGKIPTVGMGDCIDAYLLVLLLLPRPIDHCTRLNDHFSQGSVGFPLANVLDRPNQLTGDDQDW